MSNIIKSEIQVKNLELFYGENKALKNISIDIEAKKVTALIGPSGCGKSTFLRTLNRMNDLIEGVKINGQILIDGKDIYKDYEEIDLRKKVGMVFQKPNPFPMSIYDNIAYGPRIHGIKDKRTLDQIVENSLKGAALFDEVKDRLKKSAIGLSGGQQQRLCIARTIAVSPEIILMDEPTSALDVTVQAQVVQTLKELRNNFDTSIIMVTHNMGIVANISDTIGVMYYGHLLEIGPKIEILKNPQHQYTIELLKSIPTLNGETPKGIDGKIPEFGSVIEGCPFYDRCKICDIKCKTTKPELKETSNGHFTSCLKYTEVENNIYLGEVL